MHARARTTRMRWRAHIGIRAYPAGNVCAFAQMASACHFACIGRSRRAPTATPTRTAGMAGAAGIPPTRTADGHESPKAPPSIRSVPAQLGTSPGPDVRMRAHCQSWHIRGVRLCHGRRRRPDHLKPASARWLGCAAWFLGCCSRFPIIPASAARAARACRRLGLRCTAGACVPQRRGSACRCSRGRG